MPRYQLGSLVRLTNTFRDVAGALADPTTVTITITNPAGTVTTPTAVKDSTGIYYVDLTANVAGTWTYVWAGTGAVVATDTGYFFAGSASPQYASIAEYTAYPTGTKAPADVELDALLVAASAMIDEACGHGSGAFLALTSSARTFDGNGKASMSIPSAVSLESVTVAGAAIPAGYFYGWRSAEHRPYSVLKLKSPYVFIEDAQNVVITATWGFAAYPPDGVVHATILQAAELIKERGSQAIASPGRTGPAQNAGRTRVAQHADKILMPFKRIA